MSQKVSSSAINYAKGVFTNEEILPREDRFNNNCIFLLYRSQTDVVHVFRFLQQNCKCLATRECSFHLDNPLFFLSWSSKSRLASNYFSFFFFCFFVCPLIVYGIQLHSIQEDKHKMVPLKQMQMRIPSTPGICF